MTHKKKRFYILLVFILAIIITCLFSLNRCKSQDEAGKHATDIDTIPVLVTRIQHCSRINTAEVQVHKIITHDDNMQLKGKVMGQEISIDLPAGKRKVAIPMYATIKASIDVSQLTEDDIRREGSKIEVFLPRPTTAITETHIDHDGIKQYVALTRSNFSDEELQSYEAQGRAAIEKDIPGMGIEAMARESAARQIIPIIEMMGYKEKDITISFREDDNKKNNTINRRNN